MANIVRQERGNLSSMREVAELAGVSVSTVAAVINENKFVSPERKRRIEMAILQTGYRKRRASEGDELRRSVAVILPGTYSSFFPPLLNGISDVATEENMLVTLCDSSRSIQREKELLQMCRRRGIRNIILDSVCDMKHEAAYFSEMRQELLERYGMNIRYMWTITPPVTKSRGIWWNAAAGIWPTSAAQACSPTRKGAKKRFCAR